MFTGLTVTFPLALFLLGLDILGKAPWPGQAMDWLLQYSLVIVLPYCTKMISYMFSKSANVSADSIQADVTINAEESE